MKYNPKIHHRRSIRLKGYDYSQAGLYFITICVQHRECLFGYVRPATRRGEPTCSPDISSDVLPDISPDTPQMILNDAGKMVEKWYYELENKFLDIKCHEMIIMPNHFHCIIEIVRADLRVCPDDDNPILGEHKGSSLHRVVQWFKTMTTNEYIRGVKNLGWKRFDGKLWQRNYYEHIIRNEQAYENIANYIINNPAKWQQDKFFNL